MGTSPSHKKYKNRKAYFKILIVLWSVIYIGLLVFSNQRINLYVEEEIGNRSMVLATDIANRLKLKNEDILYLKSLTFEELLNSKINQEFEETARKVMDISEYKYIYIISRVNEENKKYCGQIVYLLDAAESFEARLDYAKEKEYYDDELRYDEADELFIQVEKSKTPAYKVVEDKWGEYIYAYAPIYSIEGDYIGVVGVDMPTVKCKEIKGKYLFLIVIFSLVNLGIGIIAFSLYQYMKKVHKELEEERYISGIDELTGVLNRRRFDEVFSYEWEKALRDKLHICLILIDLDYFKEYNDNYGHSAGDLILKTIGEALMDEVTKYGGYVSRYGGDEFEILLPNTDIIKGEEIGYAISETIENLDLDHSYSPISDIQTVSVGVTSVIPTKEMDRKTFFNYADTALYLSKRYGRNRVSIWKI